MEEFCLFFLTVTVFFTIINKVWKNNDIVNIRSTIDNRNYVVRKLPDAKLASNKLASINIKVQRLIENIDREKEGASDLIKNYNPNTLSETLLGSKYTSYSVNKGEKISICIRKNNEEFIDDNTILFVVIHELAHVMTHEVGHTPLFWDNMKYLLEVGEKIGIYIPINYSITPVKYCGMEINTTPYEFK